MEKKACYILIGMGLLFSGLLIFQYTKLPTSATTYHKTDFSLQADSATQQIKGRAATSDTQIYPINLNTSTADDLSANLSGIGDVIANRIIEYREQNGPFSSVDELINVKGIGEKKLSSIRNYVTVD